MRKVLLREVFFTLFLMRKVLAAVKFVSYFTVFLFMCNRAVADASS